MNPDVNKSEFSANSEVATLAGGCFWCLEAIFDDLKGVTDVVSGYSGGQMANPSYEQVSTGRTGHAETVQVTFDPAQISFKEILHAFFTILSCRRAAMRWSTSRRSSSRTWHRRPEAVPREIT